MTDLEAVAKIVNSLHYARDLIESPVTVRTRTWWDGIRNTWTYDEQNVLALARARYQQSRARNFSRGK